MWRRKRPLDNNKKVLSNGIEKGSKALIPSGGHETISTAGAKAEWPAAQKTVKKAITSLITKRKKPIVNPFLTSLVWFPKIEPSVLISPNQKKHYTYCCYKT